MAQHDDTDEYATFFADVRERLKHMYGESAVDVRPELPETEYVPDFRVDAPLCRFLVFIALDTDNALGALGVGQLCAAHDRHGVPVLIVPTGMLDTPEVDLLAQRTPIVVAPHDTSSSYV